MIIIGRWGQGRNWTWSDGEAKVWHAKRAAIFNDIHDGRTVPHELLIKKKKQ